MMMMMMTIVRARRVIVLRIVEWTTLMRLMLSAIPERLVDEGVVAREAAAANAPAVVGGEAGNSDVLVAGRPSVAFAGRRVLV